MIKTLAPADQVFLSFKNALKAFSILSKLRLNWVYLTPVVIYILIFAFGLSLTNDLHESLMSFLKSWVGRIEEGDGILSFLFTATSVLTWIIIKISLFLIFGILSGYVALIVLSPLLTYVAEKVDEELSGEKRPFNFLKFVKDVLRAIFIALRNSLIQISWTIGLLILSLIPGINLFTAPLLFFITAYFYGFSFLDYSLEIKEYRVKDSILQVRRMKWASVCLGSMFLFLNMIPWIGTIFSTFLIFHLVTSATMIMDAANKEEKVNDLQKDI